MKSSQLLSQNMNVILSQQVEIGLFDIVKGTIYMALVPIFETDSESQLKV